MTKAKRPPMARQLPEKPTDTVSWWTFPVPQDAWYALARRQCDRMMGSQIAKQMGYRKSLDDLYLGKKNT